MKAIETRFHGPTNTKGARISATDLDGNRVMVEYDHSRSSEDGHADAALALCRKMGWKGQLVAGTTKRGHVFVFLDWYTPVYSTDEAPKEHINRVFWFPGDLPDHP